MRQHLINESLQSWELLNDHIGELDEPELKALLNVELQHGKRKQFLIRVHARYCKLRNSRERLEMLRVCE